MHFIINSSVHLGESPGCKLVHIDAQYGNMFMHTVALKLNYVVKLYNGSFVKWD